MLYFFIIFVPHGLLSMKKLIYIIAIALIGCGVPSKEHSRVITERDSLKFELSKAIGYVHSLQDSIVVLSYPANQRFDAITDLIKQGKLDSALAEIEELQRIFPKSKEAIASISQIDIITQKKEQLRKEEERRKALGFKVFKDNSTITLTDKDGKVRKCSFGSFSYGRTFTFDYCDDVGEYSYRTADKDKTYILSSMTMSTKEKFAITPSIFTFKIEGDTLKKIGGFQDEYASWISYGAKIGNYSDDTHDFSKVNSVRYKIASEISVENSKLPLVILTSKDGSWVNNELTIEDVHQKCIVVKILNRSNI